MPLDLEDLESEPESNTGQAQEAYPSWMFACADRTLFVKQSWTRERLSHAVKSRQMTRRMRRMKM
eukprot:5345462-Amphidinium_carterae.1